MQLGKVKWRNSVLGIAGGEGRRASKSEGVGKSLFAAVHDVLLVLLFFFFLF